MAIYRNNKEITGVYLNNKAISAIYKGAVLVWEAIRSCFGKGYWISRYPWSNKDGWKNNS